MNSPRFCEACVIAKIGEEFIVKLILERYETAINNNDHRIGGDSRQCDGADD